MSGWMDQLIARQVDIAKDKASPLNVPRFSSYTVCNLRGGIGKTSLTFNLAYLTDDLLAVDTCPQGNLSFFFDNQYFQHPQTTVYDLLLPHFLPGLGTATRAAQLIRATNHFFQGKNSYFLPSDPQLYLLPSQMANALLQTNTIIGNQRQMALDNMLYSLKAEIMREQSETGTTRCLIDTSPFFSGATHLAWHATDALIVPVSIDQQSINSLGLLLQTLSNSASEFRRTMPSDQHTPRIQMVVLTRCGWSTVKGAKSTPNQQTKLFLGMVHDLINRHITHFTTPEPCNHIVLLDDFLGSGRISSARSEPLPCLNVRDTARFGGIRAEVNAAIDKIKSQLKFISSSIW